MMQALEIIGLTLIGSVYFIVLVYAVSFMATSGWRAGMYGDERKKKDNETGK